REQRRDDERGRNGVAARRRAARAVYLDDARGTEVDPAVVVTRRRRRAGDLAASRRRAGGGAARVGVPRAAAAAAVRDGGEPDLAAVRERSVAITEPLVARDDRARSREARGAGVGQRTGVPAGRRRIDARARCRDA